MMMKVVSNLVIPLDAGEVRGLGGLGVGTTVLIKKGFSLVGQVKLLSLA